MKTLTARSAGNCKTGRFISGVSALTWGGLGMEDQQQIIPLLHALRRPTFFTLARDFSRQELCHSGHCLVYLDIEPDEAAVYIRRFLRHPSFRTQAQRMGKVVRVRHVGLSWWEVGVKAERALSW